MKKIRTRRNMRRLEEAILKWIIRITALILMCIVGSFAFYGWLVWQYM